MCAYCTWGMGVLEWSGAHFEYMYMDSACWDIDYRVAESVLISFWCWSLSGCQVIFVLFFAYMYAASTDSIICQVAEPMHSTLWPLHCIIAATYMQAMLSACSGSPNNALHSSSILCTTMHNVAWRQDNTYPVRADSAWTGFRLARLSHVCKSVEIWMHKLLHDSAAMFPAMFPAMFSAMFKIKQ